MQESYQQPLNPYTEFFSWGSDSHGQLALANTDDDPDYGKAKFFVQPRTLSFDVIIS